MSTQPKASWCFTIKPSAAVTAMGL